MSVPQTRLLIVSDQQSVRQGLSMYLGTERDLFVLGEADSEQAALELTTRLCPDIVLIDADTLHIDGMALVSTLHRLCFESLLIVLSINDDPSASEEALHLGAEAFVTKASHPDVLLNTIRQIARSPQTNRN